MSGRAARPWREFAAAVRADHAAMRAHDERYAGSPARGGGLARDLVVRIGFQMMFAYRAMRLCAALGIPLAPQIVSRLIRHLYGADIHWDADLAPGVTLVHGMGICINGSARVGPGAILFQNVTLGLSIHPETRAVGAPELGRDVHVGPGATLVGPISIGAASKIAAGCLVTTSIPAGSLVQAEPPAIRRRTTAGPRGLSAAASARP